MPNLLANLRKSSSKDFVQKVLEKSKTTNKTPKQLSKSGTLTDRIKIICDFVESKLGHLRNEFECITDENELKTYFDDIIKNGEAAIDTETTGLNPMQDHIVGFCMYTPGRKAAYVPLNHVKSLTRALVDGQIKPEILKNEIKRAIDANVNWIYFNAVFDIRVCRHSLGIDIPCYWDASVAARIFKDNEKEANLKYLWKKYCGNIEDEHFTFEKLFQGLCFDVVPIKVAYLYAAKDSIMTYELYKFQHQYLSPDGKEVNRAKTSKLAKLFTEIESPLIPLVANMEDRGVNLDTNYCKELSIEYHTLLEEKKAVFYNILNEYSDKLNSYLSTHPNTKIKVPLNIGSPTQIAELLYDVLEIPPVSRKQPRSTEEKYISKIDHPLCSALLDYRGIDKLLTTYIDKMPNVIDPKDKRVHAKFNSVGTDTGRFSSSDPNLQNIPSHNKDIRPMFTASPGYVLIGADYSQQEPKITADLSNDEVFIKNCYEGKDAYGIVASVAFNKPYEECLEFRPDGTTNPEGKERRSTAKWVLLGICYGKSVQTLAEDLKVSIKEAEEIQQAVFRSLPGLKTLMDESQEMARKLGYVETKWGRRRHIPDMQLEPFVLELTGTVNFDPFFDSQQLGVMTDIDRTKQRIIKDLMAATSHKQKQIIKDKAFKAGFKVKDNTFFIEEARRQCVNSRVQGSAADQTKIAFRVLGQHEELKRLNFYPLLQVHDEIIGECPIENVREVSKLFEQSMLSAAKDLRTGAKCDLVISYRWYGEDVKLNQVTDEELMAWYHKEVNKNFEQIKKSL